jgi:hypothetical protein
MTVDAINARALVCDILGGRCECVVTLHEKTMKYISEIAPGIDKTEAKGE